MRTDSQARSAVRLAAIRNVLTLAGDAQWWEAYDALLDMGITPAEIERALRES